MIDSYTLRQYSKVNLSKVSIDDLVDLRNVNINTLLPVEEKIPLFLEQVKNPYIFKIENTKVKISFGSKMSFSDAVAAAVENTRNYQTYYG